MGLESGTYISSLVSSNPTSSDQISAGDDHIRLIKSLILASLPDVNAAVATIHTGTSAPTSPTQGTIWYDTNSSPNILKIYDGSSWVSFGTAPWNVPSASAAPPTGAISPYAAATAPTGWLLCDGSAVSRATYSDLFTVVSTTYGSGDGSTTFNVPDLRGRSVVSQAASGTFSTLAGTGGAETHTLTTSEIPSHNHSLSDPSIGYADGSTADLGTGQSIVGAVHTVTVGSTGGGSAHNIMSPYMVLPHIIKT